VDVTGRPIDIGKALDNIEKAKKIGMFWDPNAPKGTDLAATSEEKEEARAGIEAGTEAIMMADKMNRLTHDPSNPTGRVAGSFAGRGAASFVAIFGSDQKYSTQDQLNQIISQQAITLATKMKGNLSDKDVKFLKDSLPKLSSSDDVWAAYVEGVRLRGQGAAARGRAALGQAQPGDEVFLDPEYIQKQESESSAYEFHPGDMAVSEDGWLGVVRSGEFIPLTVDQQKFVQVFNRGAVRAAGASQPAGAPQPARAVSARLQ
jgi:hypothetical protein